MGIFMVETYLVAPDKQREFKSLMESLLKYKNDNPELFKEVKSWKLLSQMFGGIAGSYIEMWEFSNMADLEFSWKKQNKDEGFMGIHKEFLRLIEPATFSIRIWNSISVSK